MIYIIRDNSALELLLGGSDWASGTYLDTLQPASIQVGYGRLGRFGELGYDSARAVVCGRPILRGLSAHAPSHLRYELAGGFSNFRTIVGVADYAKPSQTKCTFALRVDGLDCCEPVTITAGANPRLISLDLRGARWLELEVIADRFDHAHSVWIDPQLVPVRGSRPRYIRAAAQREPPISHANQVLTLSVHGNLGDQAAYTGLPFAYWNATGSLLHTISDRQEFQCLWERNPYCMLVEAPVGRVHRVRFESYGDFSDWNRYRPLRVFNELTGLQASAEDVSPALYYDRTPRERRVVVCDQASWANRRGYPHLNSMMERLREGGWEVIYVRNTEISERQVFCEHIMVRLSLPDTIALMNTASLFVGYDSGLAHIAAGLNVPSVQFAGSTPPRAFMHRNCIYCLEACQHCCTDWCASNCLTRSEDKNDEILSVIAGRFREAM